MKTMKRLNQLTVSELKAPRNQLIRAKHMVELIQRLICEAIDDAHEEHDARYHAKLAGAWETLQSEVVVLMLA